MKYTEQAVETLDDAGSVIANKNIEIEQLRQRVAELEKERDRLVQLCGKWNFECDEMREDNKRLANVADALMQQRDELLKACETYMSHGICEVTYYAIRNAIASVKEKA